MSIKPSYEAIAAAQEAFDWGTWDDVLAAAYAIDGVPGVRLAMSDEEAIRHFEEQREAYQASNAAWHVFLRNTLREVRATVPADAPAFQAAPGLDMKVEGAFSIGAIKRDVDPDDAPPQPDPRDAEIAELRRQIRLKEDYEKRLLDDIAELRKVARETPAAVVHVRPFSVLDIKAVRQAAREAADAAEKWRRDDGWDEVRANKALDAIAAAFCAIAGDDK